LLCNPHATATGRGVVDAVARVLAAQLSLDVEMTTRRDHAVELAAAAVRDGCEVVVALGGDGTVNEAMQAVAGSAAKLALVPGGSTNVWARTLGLPRDPLAAAGAILEALRARRERRVHLGTANGRYFGFTAGFGYDAEVVRLVERHERLRRLLGKGSFVWCGLLALLRGFAPRGARVTVTTDEGERLEGLRTVVCCNSDPYSYVGDRPSRLCPDADLAGGLDAIGAERVDLGAVLRMARGALSPGGLGPMRRVHRWHDHTGFELSATAALPLQVDGDYVGRAATVSLGSARDALTLVA
ncbi:MAG: diacylglycerol kinase family lipid kinase, partial [Actinobacteria bacterium]|nr:diacylglycerol kinase family lipid kinase [Actinomycetota bacterium]